MLRRHLLYAVSLAALASTSAALAQQSLPTIEVGASTRGTGTGRAAAGGARSTGDAGGSGSGVGSGGAGKPVLTSQNSYVVPNASTATKTDTPIMDTPINVQVVTQKVMDDQQDTTLAQALTNISSVTVGTGSQVGGQGRTSGIFIRGFQTRDYYQDGFRVVGSIGSLDVTATKQLANVGSIELLKGPAAILYGLSEPGGIINITTKAPQDTPHYTVQQQIGALALYRTRLAATGPLTPDKSVLYRIDMSYENDGAPYGSFIDRTHSRNYFVAPVVKWQIDNATWVKAEGSYNNDLVSQYSSYVPTFLGFFVRPPRNNNYWGYSPVLQRNVYAALTGEHKFNDNWLLRSRVAFYSTNNDSTLNNPISTSAGPNPRVTLFTSYGKDLLSSWQTNQDLVGHFDLLGTKNTLLLGGDYSRFTYASVSQSAVPWGFSLISAALPIFPGLPIRPVVQTLHSEQFNRQDTAGFYVQDQIELPYGIHVLAGGRYQYIFQWNTLASNFGSFVSGPVQSTADPLHAASVTPRVGLLWRPREWVSLYGNYAEGFGANSGVIYPGTLAPPSNAKSWEAGAKFEFFDGRLRATFDYYYLLKTNIPIGDPDPTHLCGGTPSCSVIVGAARSTGPEVDIQGELLPGWNVVLNYTNQDVRIADGTASGNSGNGLANLKPGQRFPNIARNLARLWTTYEFQDPSLTGLKVGAGYTYHGSQPVLDGSNGYKGLIPLLSSWGTVDLMAAYRFDLDGVKTTAQINATNIFNCTYYTDASVIGAPSRNLNATGGRLSYGAPFNIVGSLRMEF